MLRLAWVRGQPQVFQHAKKGCFIVFPLCIQAKWPLNFERLSGFHFQSPRSCAGTTKLSFYISSGDSNSVSKLLHQALSSLSITILLHPPSFILWEAPPQNMGPISARLRIPEKDHSKQVTNSIQNSFERGRTRTNTANSFPGKPFGAFQHHYVRTLFGITARSCAKDRVRTMLWCRKEIQASLGPPEMETVKPLLKREKSALQSKDLSKSLGGRLMTLGM